MKVKLIQNIRRVIRMLAGFPVTSIRNLEATGSILQLQNISREINDLKSRAGNKSLLRYGSKIYSQNEEEFRSLKV